MCLTAKNIEPNIAEKDIICFKVLEKNKDKNYPYRTPYRKMLIEKEVISGTKELIGEGNRNNKSFFLAERWQQGVIFTPLKIMKLLLMNVKFLMKNGLNMVLNIMCLNA